MNVTRLLEAVRRFHTKVQYHSSGCWLWTAGKSDGYGQFSFLGRTVRAHRFSYWVHRGDYWSSELILHLCDVRHCVCPKHLYVGDHADNRADDLTKVDRYYSDFMDVPPDFDEDDPAWDFLKDILEET